MTEPMTGERLAEMEVQREEAELELIALAQHSAARPVRQAIAARHPRVRHAAKQA